MALDFKIPKAGTQRAALSLFLAVLLLGAILPAEGQKIRKRTGVKTRWSTDFSVKKDTLNLHIEAKLLDAAALYNYSILFLNEVPANILLLIQPSLGGKKAEKPDIFVLYQFGGVRQQGHPYLVEERLSRDRMFFTYGVNPFLNEFGHPRFQVILVTIANDGDDPVYPEVSQCTAWSDKMRRLEVLEPEEILAQIERNETAARRGLEASTSRRSRSKILQKIIWDNVLGETEIKRGEYARGLLVFDRREKAGDIRGFSLPILIGNETGNVQETHQIRLRF